jgi:hypothetical protein
MPPIRRAHAWLVTGPLGNAIATGLDVVEFALRMARRRFTDS